MQTAPQVEGLETLDPDDRAGIGATLGALLTGFEQRDADALDGLYADDADWVNAFGSVKRGNDEIVAYLRLLFADADFDAGELVEPPTVRLRTAGTDAVVVSSHLRIRGQLLVGGGEMAVRDNFSFRVLLRGGDGRWRIVSEIFSDANTQQSFAGHS